MVSVATVGENRGIGQMFVGPQLSSCNKRWLVLLPGINSQLTNHKQEENTIKLCSTNSSGSLERGLLRDLTRDLPRNLPRDLPRDLPLSSWPTVALTLLLHLPILLQLHSMFSYIMMFFTNWVLILTFRFITVGTYWWSNCQLKKPPPASLTRFLFLVMFSHTVLVVTHRNRS